MPPRQSGKKTRLPSIAANIRAITGMATDEKAHLVRIGNLVDSLLLSERNLANPGETEGRALSAKVPKPENLEATVIVGGVDVTWDAVDFSRFAQYEVHHDESTLFANPVVLDAFTNKITIKGFTTLTRAIRVRTVSRAGEASEFASTGALSTQSNVFDIDTDHDVFDGRHRVEPGTVRPKLFGKNFSGNVSGALAFIGLGGAVSPSPISFSDPLDVERTGLRNQIPYTLLENDTVSTTRTAGIPTLFYESAFVQGRVRGRQYDTFPGSFVDFFPIATVNFEPDAFDVRFLDYLQSPHEQVGVVHNAAVSIIKH
jgi:hypothetical protein